ncbi:MAG: asparaginase [Ruminococcus sp.]|nr:asparaginase [Ruminococcus sp.]
MGSPVHILSENLCFDDWNALIKALCAYDLNRCSGVIITHGSDTLAYTSALIGMLFRHTPVPIIITAANKPLDVSGTNGLFNFTSSVRLIKEGRYIGVFTVYEKVYLSTRLLPADTALDRFSCYGGEEGFEGVSEYRLDKPREQIIDPCIALQNEVLMITPYPNFNYSTVSLSSRPAAVLHTLYHSGTACTDLSHGGERSLISFAKKCKALDIPLYLCGTKGGKADIYSSMGQISDLGVNTIDRISDVAAYTKLVIAYNQQQVNPARIIYTNLFFEFL